MPKKKVAPKKKFQPVVTPKQINNIINEIPELHKKKAASIEFRRNIIEKQNRDNYANELHRLQGFISSYTLPRLEEDRIRGHMDSLINKYNKSYDYRFGGSLYKESISNHWPGAHQPR